MPCLPCLRCAVAPTPGRIEIYDGGKKVGSDSMNANPVTDPLSYTAAANPGKTVTLK